MSTPAATIPLSGADASDASLQCGDACGWAAALLAAIAFGSFGVPIKSDAARSVDIDPLVFQSYKTFMCFMTSWLILLSGESFVFTPWGIVAGFFWVPGGVANIYAVKAAGLAIGFGMSASCVVLSSFTWGIFVFHERVHSQTNACLDILCLIGGLLGMSYFSYSATNPKADPADANEGSTSSSTPTEASFRSASMDQNDARQSSNNLLLVDTSEASEPTVELSALTKRVRQRPTEPGESSNITAESNDESIVLLGSSHHEKTSMTISATDGTEYVKIWGHKIPKRTWGMMLAGVFGLWIGSSMVPMKLAPPEAQGSRFLISFAIGASIVNLTLWLVRYLYGVYQYQSFSEAYTALPSLHWRVMWKPGCLSGLLWSIGNFFNLLSVFYLGQGVGYPLVQSSMVISGLWGIFYFKEVQGWDRISKWILSSLFALAGIVMLGREHAKD